MISTATERSEMVPPHNEDAECAFLCCLLLNNNEAMQSHRPDPETFYFRRNQILADAFCSLWDSDERWFDSIALAEHLLRNGLFEEAGGAAYIGKILDTEFSAAHVGLYEGIVREKFQRRELMKKLEVLQGEIRRPDSDIEILIQHTAEMLKASRLQSQSKLNFQDAWAGAFSPPEMREVIIEGLLRRGEVGNFIASTKTGKSWFALLLMLCVSTGRDWLGRRVARGNVLLIDNELHTSTIENRLFEVARAMQIDPEEPRDQFEYLSCRGNWVSIQDLIRDIPKKYAPGSLNLIVIDAKYRLFGDGLQENSNDDQTKFGNLIDQFAGLMNCPIVMVHHSTKGDQAGKSVTDIGSGGGSQARSVDLHLVLRPHEEPGFAVMDAECRSFPKAEPITLRWDWPLWSAEVDLEPVLHMEKSKGDSRQETKDDTGVQELKKILELKDSPLSRSALHKAFGGGKERLHRLIRIGVDKGVFQAAGTKTAQNGEVAELFTLAGKHDSNVQRSVSTV
jgi:RecA-family ATPase